MVMQQDLSHIKPTLLFHTPLSPHDDGLQNVIHQEVIVEQTNSKLKGWFGEYL